MKRGDAMFFLPFDMMTHCFSGKSRKSPRSRHRFSGKSRKSPLGDSVLDDLGSAGDAVSLSVQEVAAHVVPEPRLKIDVGAVPKPKHKPKIDVGAVYKPKIGVHPLGEDAHFISSARSAFGVADVVGGWTSEGVDAGEFPRQLMAACQAELEAAEEDAFCGDAATDELVRVLERAVARTTAVGTSTAFLAVVDGRVLRAINLGDSGFVVVRGDDVVFHSPVQQSEFNTPFQLGRVIWATPPDHAMRLDVEIQAGDIIVAGSDGLFDNLFDDGIKAALAKAQAAGRGAPEEMARELAWAVDEACVEVAKTPFEVACWEKRIPWWGGKCDDVTVVVARVL